MSSRACRIVGADAVRRFDWTRVDHEAVAAFDFAPVELSSPVPEVVGLSMAEQQAHLAALEREAFTKGYAAGERAGLEAGGKRADAMLRRVAQTIEELSGLRATIQRETERQMVELALALARRIVDRELTLAPDLVAALAHVALHRLGETSPATIRLNPDDYSTVVSHRGAQWEGTQVSVVPDPAVARGGCLVESDFGVIDASAEAQLGELARALLGETSPDRREEAPRAR